MLLHYPKLGNTVPFYEVLSQSSKLVPLTSMSTPIIISDNFYRCSSMRPMRASCSKDIYALRSSTPSHSLAFLNETICAEG